MRQQLDCEGTDRYHSTDEIYFQGNIFIALTPYNSIDPIVTDGNDTDRCLKVKKVTIVEIGVKSTVNEVVLGVTTGKGWVPDNGQ